MTTATTTAPTWVSFPAFAMPAVNWLDHHEAHQAVMRLFTRDLPGGPRERRSNAGVLYRLDLQPDGTPLVLVQTRHPVELLPPSASALIVPEARWHFASGQEVMFRVAVNPLSRRTVNTGLPKRHEVVRVLPAAEVPQWLTARLDPVMKVRTIMNAYRTVTHAKRRGNGRGAVPPQVVVETVDAVGVVTDADGFSRLRLDGVGRAKSYGCGLLTAVAAS